MKLRFVVVLLFIALTSAAAQAQVGLFFNPIATSVSNSTADPGTFSFLGQGKTERLFGGIAVGAYYDFFKSGRFGAGFELRDEKLDGNGASLNNLFGGARLTYTPKNSRFRPYLMPVVGEGRSQSPDTGVHITKIEYGVRVGSDFRVARHIDLRLLEVGYSTLNTASDGTIGGTVDIPSSKLLSFSTGLVFRFP